ncbi:MAG: carboxypeptidase regulatory-like domain-containing protein [Sedimentisphaerales bacterium]|nr:carboxypeptidase regulatory-like domain-containing protein [Sedimentisphaerales bacterium]
MKSTTRIRILAIVFLIVLTPSLVTWGEVRTITGRVVNCQARPVADAEVAVFERVYDYASTDDTGVLRDEIRRTDNEGRFVLTADVTFSAIGMYLIVARKDGYALGWDGLGRPYDNVIVLEQPSVLAGVLLDSEDRPVAGATVRAAPKSSYLERLDQTPVLAPQSWLTTQTNEQGAFRFDRFSADVSTDFWVEAPGWAQVYQFTTQRMSACGFEVGRTDIRLVLPREVPLQGQVIDADSGASIAGARVLLHPKSIDHDKNPFTPVVTTSGQDGRFAFKGVPPGERYVKVSAPPETGLVDRRVTFDVRAGAEPTKVTAELRRGGTIEIVAQEQETGEPIAGLPVQFWQAVQNESSDFYTSARTDANGLLRIQAPLGECALSTRTDSYSPMFYDSQVMVAQGQTVRAEIVLDRYARVSGVALDEAGQPVGGAEIGGALAPTDQAGRFEARRPSDDRAVVWVARHPERNLAAVVNPADLGPSPRMVLNPALSVCGTVTDPNGKGIPAARVALYLNTPGALMPYAPDVTTDSQGRFEVSAVAPEQEGFNYRLSVDASGFGGWRYRRISVTPQPDRRAQIEPVVLPPADRSVSGIVVDANGSPVAGVPIHARGTDQPSRSTATDSAGRFVVRRVCQGPLRIQASYDNWPGGAGHLRAEGGDQDVTIILGQERVHTDYASLEGKPLPDGNEIGLDLSRTDLRDRAILLCFFDFQQRPSRAAFLQLARQADALKQKDVVVMAVQTSEVEDDALAGWIEQSEVTLPIERIRRDVNATRLAWGVKSLPWLILADRERVVRAEGFPLSELDDKIEAMTGKESR